MKERPILFSAPMVQAILAGNKTQTRRVVKLPKKAKWGTEYDGQVIIDDGSTFRHDIEVDELKCPHGQVGDRLWVRETWQGVILDEDEQEEARENGREAFMNPQHCIYKASDNIDRMIDEDGDQLKWKPSIFMPRWASRILLEITGVRVERLHDISEQDAIAEGIEVLPLQSKNNPSAWYQVGNGLFQGRSARAVYLKLWESINGRESLDANLFVWVIEFKVIEAK